MTKEVAKRQEVVEFPALLTDTRELREALAENLGGAGISPFDLDRVSIPAGGSQTWVLQTLEGEQETKELVGIVIWVQNARAYWPGEFGGGNVPPQCMSDDAVTGVGDPGGACHTCPFAQFGSDARGRGQACKMVQRMFLLQPGGNLPMVVNLPPGSLKNAKKYLLRLVSNGQKASGVVTRITLEKDRNQDGIVFAKATFAMVGKLDQEMAARAKAYGMEMGRAFRGVSTQDFAAE